MRVLVIDDDRDVGEALVLLFSDAGHDVSWAADRQTALAMAGREPPHVVLLDLYLADGSSLDLVPRLGGAPTFVITAMRPPREVVAATARCGAVALLSKSIDPAELLARVERGLSHRLTPAP